MKIMPQLLIVYPGKSYVTAVDCVPRKKLSQLLIMYLGKSYVTAADHVPRKKLCHSCTFQLYWVKDVCMFRSNLLPALLAAWPGSFMCNCGNTVWDGHWIRRPYLIWKHPYIGSHLNFAIHKRVVRYTMLMKQLNRSAKCCPQAIKFQVKLLELVWTGKTCNNSDNNSNNNNNNNSISMALNLVRQDHSKHKHMSTHAHKYTTHNLQPYSS